MVVAGLSGVVVAVVAAAVVGADAGIGTVVALGSVPGAEGLWVAGGYSGHGMVLGFMCGELVANAILGREAPDLDLFVHYWLAHEHTA